MDGNPSRQVARRRVFHIPGYDPIHPRRYRELYRTEGAAQAAVSGYAIALSPKAGGGPYGWLVTGWMDGAEVRVEIEVLTWSDIVRDSMSGGIAATYGQLVRTAWTYVATGTLRRLMWLRKGPVIAALYPVGMLLLQLAVALWLASVAGSLVATFVVFVVALALMGLFGAPVMDGSISSVGSQWMLSTWWVICPTVTAFVAWSLLRWFKSKDNRLYAYYLMHDYAFTARWRGASPPAMEARMDAFGDAIAGALRDGCDEVLVVGHSSGAHLAVSVLADLIRAGRVPAEAPALAFLSLGQVIPMMSFLPEAHRLRADLAYLSTTDALTWVDVTAPGDGCAFALCDPVAVSGVQPPGARWPLVISAAFTRTLSPEKWKALRWRFLRLHFQYLCAFDRPGDYDYFRITAGPLTLAGRYAGRAPSKSRIDVPASKYTSIAA